MTELTGGHALVRALAAHGAEVAFGIPGTHNLEIYGWLAYYEVRHVTTRHEQGAGYAADGYARATGRPGIVITTTGPAVLNAAAAAAQAYSDSVPMLLISPGMPLRHPVLPTGLLHESKAQSRALDSVVAWSHRVGSVAEIEVAVARAYASFATGRPRPVHLEVPLDLMVEWATVGTSPLLAPTLPSTAVPAELVVRAAEALQAARMVTIVAGGGARAAGPALTALAEALGAPVVTSANGKGVVDEEHPLSLGVGLHLPAVQERLRASELVLAIGTELAESDFWCEPPTLQPLVRIDIDPAQAFAGAPAHLALIGDAAQAVPALVDALGPVDPADRDDALRQTRDSQAREQGRRWLPWLAAVREVVSKDAVFTSDSAMACYYGALANLPIGTQARYLHPTGFGTLGYALPAAVGVKTAYPDRQVVALSGDGGFQFSVNELATAAALAAPLPILVFDNGGYGEIRVEMADRGDQPVAVDLVTPDLPAIARAYGGEGTRVKTPDDLRSALRKALKTPCPTVIVIPEELS